jgi:5-methylcytosine-specific restriction protein B
MPMPSEHRVPSRFPDERVAEFFRAVCESLKRRGGSATKSEVLDDVRSSVELTGDELSRNASGNERWQTSLLFNFIAFNKAGFLRRKSGSWQLLDAGRAAMDSLSPIDMLQAARDRYEDWASARTEDEDPGRELPVTGSPLAQPTANRIWLIGTGVNASAWQSFKAKGEAGIDFSQDGRQLGDLSTMSRELVHRRLRELSGDRNPRNDSLACFEFAHSMKAGDVVIARTGVGRVLGIGRITGDYRFSPEDSAYAHARKVEWLDTRERVMPSRIRLPIKTLTEMSDYPDMVDLLLGRRTDAAIACLEAQGHDEESIEAFFRQAPYELPTASIAGAAADRHHDAAPSLDAIRAESFCLDDVIEATMAALRRKGAVVLQGSPGTGKTYVAHRIAHHYAGSLDRVQRVQFHPAYSYEDFVRGYRPSAGGFVAANGPIVALSSEARRSPDKNFVLFIDELNRGNVARIMGETLSLIELDKRHRQHAVKLGLGVDGDHDFWIPSNLAIVATMNTADRSIALVDYALRRRFAFIRLEPAFGRPEFSEWLADRIGPGRDEAGHDRESTRRLVSKIVDSVSAMNGIISAEKSLGPGHAIGHSFFCGFDPARGDGAERWAARVFEEEIRPLLEEYCSEQPSLRQRLIALIPTF